MDLFNIRKQQPYGIKPYGEDEKNTQPKWMNFYFFVIAALILVVLIFLMIFLFNYNNNSLKKFVDASVNNFDCGGFEYHITAGVDGDTHLDYVGEMEFDLNSQLLESSYHATYDNYEYDCVTYTHGAVAYTGNYYGGKWTTKEYTDKALDFFSFYRGYRKGDFDAGAAVRFLDFNDTLNAVQLQNSYENISKELTNSYAMENILCQKIENGENGTTITFVPKTDEVAEIILKNIASAFTSAKEFEKFETLINENKENLSNVEAVISYTINKEKYLSDIHIDYKVDGKSYEINVEMKNFRNVDVEIPDSFFDAAGIKK